MEDGPVMYSQLVSNQQWEQQRYERLRDDLGRAVTRITKLEQQAERTASGPEMHAALKSQAAQQQAQGGLNDPQLGNLAQQNLYAPLRSDTRAVVDLAAFARRLLNPQDLAHAVTLEVRNAARRALGLPEVKEYDL